MVKIPLRGMAALRRIRSGVFGVVAFLILGALSDSAAAYRRPGTTVRVNKIPGDERAHGYAGDVKGLGTGVSANGRFTVFGSSDPALAIEAGYPGSSIDVAGLATITQIYVYDSRLMKLSMVSLSSTGIPAVTPLGGFTGYPRISDSGRIVVFESDAPNLVPGDTNNARDVFARHIVAGWTRRVSVTSDGRQSTPTAAESPGPNEASPSLSADGRFVAFSSRASDLVTGDRNRSADVFVHNLKGRKTERVSVTTKGEEGIADSIGPSISRGGEFIAFCSSASNLTSDAEDRVRLVIHDRRTGQNTLADVATDGSYGSRPLGSGSLCSSHIVSADGRYVVFSTAGQGLVPNKTTSSTWSDVYLRDIPEGRTTRVSVSSFGEEGFGLSYGQAIATDGRTIAFESNANNLVGDDEGLCTCPGLFLLGVVAGAWGDGDVFIHDRSNGGTERLTINPDGTESESCIGGIADGGHEVSDVSVSATGRFVSYTSCYDGLVEGDAANGSVFDVYVSGRGEALGAEGLGGAARAARCAGTDCQPMVCVDGRCLTPGASLLVRDGESTAAPQMIYRDLYGLSAAYRPHLSDLFVSVLLDGMKTINGPAPVSGNHATLYGVQFSVGHHRYEVRAQRVAGPDYRRYGGASFGLFLVDGGVARRLAGLRGGFGTTGEEVVFSIPLEQIGLHGGGIVTDVEAFSAIGSYDTGAIKIIDRLAIR